MRIFGSISELVSAVLRKNSRAITIQASASTTYTADRTINTPPQDANSTLVSEDATQTLTNKTLTAPAISSPTGIVKADVGLGNVDNTSDATKNAATATLTNKTLTAPVINSPTGIVKGDVGLGNVDNTSDATKNAATATLTNKTLTTPIITGAQLSDFGEFTEVAAPATPASGKVRIYAKADGKMYGKDDAGVESALTAASVATPTVSGTVTSFTPVVASRIHTVAADYIITTTDGYETILVTTGAANRSITLPAASANIGRKILVKKLDSGLGKVLVTRGTGDSIEGATTSTLYLIGESVELECYNSTTWAIANQRINDNWQSYDPQFSGSATQGLGTLGSKSIFWRRCGRSSIQVQGSFDTGTNTAVTARVTLPSGYTVGVYTSGGREGNGNWNQQRSSQFQNGPLLATAATTYVEFGLIGNDAGAYNTLGNPINGTVLGSATRTSLNFTVPIAEFVT